jgi:hypothetical protein
MEERRAPSRHNDAALEKCRSVLCQNCVRCPLKLQSDTVIYGDTPMHIVVAGSRWWELR